MKYIYIFLLSVLVLCGLVYRSKVIGNNKATQTQAEIRFSKLEKLIVSSKEIRMQITDRAALDKLQDLINKSNTEFLEITAPGNYYLPVTYQALFYDGIHLEYFGSLFFYRDRTYLTINLNEDEGWMGGPSIDIRMDPLIDPSILLEMRSTFKVVSDQLTDWKSPDSNSSNQKQ